MLPRHQAGHIARSPSGSRTLARLGWTRDASSCSRNSGWRFRLVQEGLSLPLGGSKTARHTAPPRDLGRPRPNRPRPRPQRPTPHGPASPALCDRRLLAWPIVQPVPSTLLVRPAREWHSAGYLRAPPRQWRRHAESASRGGCRPARGAVDPCAAEIARHRAGVSRRAKNDRISSRAARVGWPASSMRWTVTTLCGHATTRSKNGWCRGSRRFRQDASYEAVAKRPGVGGEPLRRAEAVALEAIGQHGQVVTLEPLPDGSELGRSDVQAGGVFEG